MNFKAEGSTEPSTKEKSLFDFMQESDSLSQVQLNDITKIDDFLETPAAEMPMDPATQVLARESQKLTSLSRPAKDILGVPLFSTPIERLSKGIYFREMLPY